MKPGSGQSSRGDPRQSKNKKGKKTLPTMVYFKSFKNVQPSPPSPAWTGDEATTIKPAVKPIFEDTAMTQSMNEHYPTLLRLQQVFPQGSLFTDPEVTLAFANPEVDPVCASALFLCLAKTHSFFESGCFEVFPQEINPVGKYCVKMYENGSPIRVFFDDRIGCAGEPPECALLRHADERLMLPTLLHKAWLRYSRFEPFTSLEVVTAFTGFIPFTIPLDWARLQFWFGRPDALVALYIKDQRNEGLGSDRLFHIVDVVELDQHRKFVKLQCPCAKWRGRFSGYEEDVKHWTNQIRVILEIDPETARAADYFWMIYEDLVANFDCIMAFAPASTFTSGIRAVHHWVPKESQFYVPPPPKLLKCTGEGRLRICCAPLLTTAHVNDVKLVLKHFNWSSAEAPLALEVSTPAWKITTLDIPKQEELLEIETFSKGGFILHILGVDTQIEWVEYSDLVSVAASEGDLPFYVCLDEYATSIFKQRFELIGKVKFNLDQPGNVAFSVYVTNEIQKGNMAALLFNNDLNDIISTTNLRSGSVALTPNQRGYTLLVFGLYTESIMSVQPVDLIGKWRLRIFSDVPLSDVVDAAHMNYIEFEGRCNEMDETHQISRNVLMGACEAVVVLETSQPLSLTFQSLVDGEEVNCVRGIGFAVLPSCHVPGEKEQTKLVVRGIASEMVSGVSWKLRIFSTAPVICKEDTAPAEKTAAIIAGWEKKRKEMKTSGKKSELKNRSSDLVMPVEPPELDSNVLSKIEPEEGEGVVMTEEEIAELAPPAPAPESGELKDVASTQEITPVADPGEEVREQIAALAAKINENWDHYDQRRAMISKLFTPTPKAEEK